MHKIITPRTHSQHRVGVYSMYILVSRMPDSLAVRRESGQTVYYVSCKACERNPWHVNWFIYHSDICECPHVERD